MILVVRVVENGGMTKNLGVMPAKAGIQTWPHVPGLWIPAFAGMTQR
jgi:hypothetical protein